MADRSSTSVWRLIMLPALITLGITLLRLVGEFRHWSPTFFSAAPGGGAALVGIVWLPIILGPYLPSSCRRREKELLAGATRWVTRCSAS